MNLSRWLLNIIRNTNGGFQSIHNVARSKLLGTSGIDASGLRSLIVSSVLLGVNGAVGLSAAKITTQPSLRKEMKFQESLLIDSRDQTIDLSEGSVGRSENGVRRVSSRHEGLDIWVSVNKVTQSTEGMSNSRLHVSVGAISFSTSTKVTV